MLVADFFTGRGALAAEGAPIALTFDGCPEPLVAPVERITRMELHAPQDLAGTPTRIDLACAASSDDVRIAVDDPLTAKRVDRTVSLATTAPEGRARLLALATAELVRSTWLELELTAPPALPPASEPPAEVTAAQKAVALRVAQESNAPSWWAHGAVEGLVVPSVGSPLLGLSLGAQHAVHQAVWVDGTLSGWDGAASRSTGAVGVRAIALDATALLRTRYVDVAAGLRLGWASLSGSPSVAGLEGQSTSGVVFGPLVGARARVIGPVEVSLKTGWLTRGEKGLVAGDSDVTLGGFWASLAVGVRLGS
jgi:hypothetical protein